MQVPNPPGSGKDIAESKGVYCEMESEESWMENSNPLEQKEENKKKAKGTEKVQQRNRNR